MQRTELFDDLVALSHSEWRFIITRWRSLTEKELCKDSLWNVDNDRKEWRKFSEMASKSNFKLLQHIEGWIIKNSRKEGQTFDSYKDNVDDVWKTKGMLIIVFVIAADIIIVLALTQAALLVWVKAATEAVITPVH